MKRLFRYFIFIILINLWSCNPDEKNTEKNSFSGLYKIESFTSKNLVDLNGDLQKSQDLKSEINDYFNDYGYDLEIRPNYSNDSNSKLISIYFPEPYLSFEYPSHPNGYVEFAKNGIGFLYEFKNNEFLLLKSDNEFIVISKLELIENNRIKSTILKNYYDFGIQNWRELEIEIIYTKLE